MLNSSEELSTQAKGYFFFFFFSSQHADLASNLSILLEASFSVPSPMIFSSDAVRCHRENYRALCVVRRLRLHRRTRRSKTIPHVSLLLGTKPDIAEATRHAKEPQNDDVLLAFRTVKSYSTGTFGAGIIQRLAAWSSSSSIGMGNRRRPNDSYRLAYSPLHPFSSTRGHRQKSCQRQQPAVQSAEIFLTVGIRAGSDFSRAAMEQSTTKRKGTGRGVCLGLSTFAEDTGTLRVIG